MSTAPAPDSFWDHLSVDEPSHEATTTADTDEDYRVDMYEEEDTGVGLADLPRAKAENVTVEIDYKRNGLVIGLGGKTIEWLRLGDIDITVADSTFRSGVLGAPLRTGNAAVNGGVYG